MSTQAQENEQLRTDVERLKQAMRYAISGMDLAYNAVSKQFNDDALMYIGHHHAQLNKALNDSKT